MELCRLQVLVVVPHHSAKCLVRSPSSTVSSIVNSVEAGTEGKVVLAGNSAEVMTGPLIPPP